MLFTPSRPKGRASLLSTIALTALVASFVGAGPASPASAATTLHATDLQTNGRDDPLGIPGSPPTFGWTLDSTERGVTQSAYELQVTRDGNPVWSSGKVESSDQSDLVYSGPALESSTEYAWRVMVWDGKGAASEWSTPATFETGLLQASDWNGSSWVGKTAPFANWTDYTTTLDFTMNNAAFGVFLRSAGPGNAYMWQLNVGTSPDSVPMLVPHVRVNGNYSSLTGVDLRNFGFTRSGLVSGSHKLTFKATGTTIETSLDGKVVDTRTVTQFASGGVGVRTFGGESVTVRGLSVVKSDGTSLAAPDFAAGNPLNAGTYANNAVTVTGTTDAMLRTPETNSPLLRTTFETDKSKTIESARAYGSAHGVYELFLNGKKVGDQELAPGYTEYAKRIQSQTYDVTDLVASGKNGFGAAVGDGWWAGKVGLDGKYQYGTDLSVVARLKVVYTDGTEQWVNTDPSWKWAPGPYVASDLQLGETYDARFEQKDWSTANFDASAWSTVREMPSDTAKLSPQPDEPVRETQVLSTVAVTTPEAGATVYDLGQNMVGVARVTMTGKAGQTVRLRHAEVLNPNGTLYTANLRAAVSTDYYTFAADGTVTYEPSFTQHGFRYVELTGLDQAPAAAAVSGVVWGSDLTRTGTLETSSTMLNKLLSNVSWGARGNFLSIPTDTPARDERLGWTGDISIFAPSASYMFDMRSFLGKWMLDVRDEQKPDGQIPAVVPSTNGAFGDSGPGWQEAVVTVPYALYRAYGDVSQVKANWPNMLKFYDFAASRIGQDNLGAYASTFFTNDDWLSLEDTRFASNDTKTTALWADCVQKLAEMATAIGDPRAAELTARYAQIKKDFVAAYVSSDGTVSGGTQTAYALTLGMGLVDDAALRAKVGAKFVAKLALTDNHLTTGFIGTPYLLPAMSAIGRDDLAYKMLLKDTFPSWGYEISKGATTVWERWDSIKADGSFGDVGMNSFNHYAYGAVVDWMHQHIGGIRINEPGYKSSIIEPTPGGSLTNADAEIETVYGLLSSSWKTTSTGLAVDVTIPVNTTSQVVIPTGASQVVLEGGAPVAGVAGVRKVEADSARGVTLVTVGSGSYSFSLANASPIKVQFSAEARCIAGKVQLVIKATNNGDTAASLAMTSTYGAKNVTLAAGASTSAIFAARSKSVPAGEAKVAVTQGSATGTVTAAYAAKSCG